MDLYNFYKGIENVIDTLQKDRHELTHKDYLIMCDPFFNTDFYDEKTLLLKQRGGKKKGAAAASATPPAPPGDVKGKGDDKQKGKAGEGADAKKEGEKKGEGEAAAANNAPAVSDDEVDSANADLDKESDEMAPIKNLIKTATKIITIFAIIVCLPLVPWILLSYYSFQKLYGLYIAYIQTY